MMSVGLESPSQEGLDKVGENWLRVDRHEQSLRALLDAGIMVTSEMMIGIDGETEKSIHAAADFVDAMRVPVPRFCIMTSVPGTQLSNECKASDRLVTENLAEYNGSKAVHRPENMSPERLTELYWWLYRKVSSMRGVFRRTLLRPQAMWQPPAMLFAFFVSLHYRRYIGRRVPPNIL